MMIVSYFKSFLINFSSIGLMKRALIKVTFKLFFSIASLIFKTAGPKVIIHLLVPFKTTSHFPISSFLSSIGNKG